MIFPSLPPYRIQHKTEDIEGAQQHLVFDGMNVSSSPLGDTEGLSGTVNFQANAKLLPRKLS